jgi:hypothetical protein
LAIRVVRLRRFRHAPVMPEFTAEYKTPLINYLYCYRILLHRRSGHRQLSKRLVPNSCCGCADEAF